MNCEKAFGFAVIAAAIVEMPLATSRTSPASPGVTAFRIAPNAVATSLMDFCTAG